MYKDSLCKNNIGTGDREEKYYCAFSNLTYNQWLSGAILTEGLPEWDIVSTGYVEQWQGYSQLTISPELSFFANLSATVAPTQDVSDVY